MKDFLKHNGLWILAAGAIIAVALAVMSFFSTTSAPLVNVVNTVASPFRAAYTAVIGWFEDKQNYYEDMTALKEENESLRQQLAKMEETIRQAEADSKENAILRDLLDLRQQRRDLSDFETAAITEHAVSNWASTLTLNKGTVHGVAVGNCVIDSRGALVGLVSEVGSNWCTVLTILDSETSIGAKVFRTKDLGLAEGNFSLMGENRLRLNYLPAECQLLSGDLVMTSGLGGFLPSDLVIGYVEDIRTDDSGSSSYAEVAPAADISSLTEVCIIKSFEIVS